MLAQVCHFIHNYFERGKSEGSFTITGGAITLSFLTAGQRFRILGSAANDGIYTYHAEGVIWNDDNTELVELTDETFSGSIVAMGVPREVLDLVEDISSWVAAHADSLSSPYASESFGGYSYSKASGATGANGGSSVFGWQDMFRTRLNAYRKIA